jgi:hypothetical protein
MLKKTLIAAATAVVLAGAGVSTTTASAAAATAGVTEISWKGRWSGPDYWKGPRHGSYKNWRPRRVCEPIIRWKNVGYRYHRRWQPIVVGWDCHHRRGHWNRRWH